MTAMTQARNPQITEQHNEAASGGCAASAGVAQLELGDGYPSIVHHYPKLCFMGSKHRLLPWIYEVLAGVRFDSAIDAV